MHQSLSEILGPWTKPSTETALATRVREIWSKPINSLTNHELATCLRQSLAISHVLPIAKHRLANGVPDDSELHDTELADAIAQCEYASRADTEDRRIRGLRPSPGV